MFISLQVDWELIVGTVCGIILAVCFFGLCAWVYIGLSNELSKFFI